MSFLPDFWILNSDFFPYFPQDGPLGGQLLRVY